MADQSSLKALTDCEILVNSFVSAAIDVGEDNWQKEVTSADVLMFR